MCRFHNVASLFFQSLSTAVSCLFVLTSCRYMARTLLQSYVNAWFRRCQGMWNCLYRFPLFTSVQHLEHCFWIFCVWFSSLPFWDLQMWLSAAETFQNIIHEMMSRQIIERMRLNTYHRVAQSTIAFAQLVWNC